MSSSDEDDDIALAHPSLSRELEAAMSTSLGADESLRRTQHGPQGPLPKLSGHITYQSGSLASSSESEGEENDSEEEERKRRDVDWKEILAKAQRKTTRRDLRLEKRRLDKIAEHQIARRTRAQQLWARLRRFTNVMGFIFKLNSNVRDKSVPNSSSSEVLRILTMPVTFRQAADVKKVVGYLKRLEMIQAMNLSPSQIKELSFMLKLKKFPTSDCTIYSEGERSMCSFIVLEGFVSVRKSTPDGVMPYQELYSSGPGEIIGNDDTVSELGRFRPTTAITVSPAVLCTIRHDHAAAILGEKQEEVLERSVKFLSNIRQFRHIPKHQLIALARMCRPRQYNSGATIVREGDTVDPLKLLLIVHRGIVEVRKRHELTKHETRQKTSKFTRGVRQAVDSSGLHELDVLDPWGELMTRASKYDSEELGTTIVHAPKSKTHLTPTSSTASLKVDTRDFATLSWFHDEEEDNGSAADTDHTERPLTAIHSGKQAELLTRIVGTTLRAGAASNKMPPVDVKFAEFGPGAVLTSSEEVSLAGEDATNKEQRVGKKYQATLVAATAVELYEVSRTSLQSRLSREVLFGLRSQLQHHLHDRDLTVLKDDAERWSEYRQVVLEEKVPRYRHAADESRRLAVQAPWEKSVRTLSRPGTASAASTPRLDEDSSDIDADLLPSRRLPALSPMKLKRRPVSPDVWTAPADSLTADSLADAPSWDQTLGDSIRSTVSHLPAVSPVRRRSPPTPSLLRGRFGITADKALMTHLDDVKASPEHVALTATTVRPNATFSTDPKARAPYQPQSYLRTHFDAETPMRGTMCAGFVEQNSNYGVKMLMEKVIGEEEEMLQHDRGTTPLTTVRSRPPGTARSALKL